MIILIGMDEDNEEDRIVHITYYYQLHNPIYSIFDILLIIAHLSFIINWSFDHRKMKK